MPIGRWAVLARPCRQLLAQGQAEPVAMSAHPIYRIDQAESGDGSDCRDARLMVRHRSE